MGDKRTVKDLIDRYRDLPSRTKLLLLGSLVLTIFILFSLTGLISQRKPEDKKVSEVAIKNSPAVISNSGNLYKYIGNEVAYRSLRDDLTNLARDYFKITDPIIEFKVTGDINKPANNQIKLSGHFTDKPRDSIDLTIDLLNNGRLHIHAVAGSKSLDDYFSANSKRNQVIAMLPVSKGAYTINYDSNTDTFFLSVYDLGPEAKAAAENDLRSLLGITDLTAEKVAYFYPSADDIKSFSPPPEIAE